MVLALVPSCIYFAVGEFQQNKEEKKWKRFVEKYYDAIRMLVSFPIFSRKRNWGLILFFFFRKSGKLLDTSILIAF